MATKVNLDKRSLRQQLKELQCRKVRAMQLLSDAICTPNLVQFRWTAMEKLSLYTRELLDVTTFTIVYILNRNLTRP